MIDKLRYYIFRYGKTAWVVGGVLLFLSGIILYLKGADEYQVWDVRHNRVDDYSWWMNCIVGIAFILMGVSEKIVGFFQRD